VKKGKLVIEYVGEVITTSECEYRLKRYYKDEKNFYMLNLDANWVIDATRMGAIARFTNHSCNPNCETQKWYVRLWVLNMLTFLQECWWQTTSRDLCLS
jgi:SET domain-containing protein